MELIDNEFEEPYQICDSSGNIKEKNLEFKLNDEFLLQLYRKILLARIFDERAINLQRQGRLGTYAPCQGQEGCQVGAVQALDQDDYIFPTYRETAALLTRGVKLRNILMYWGGDERGSKISREKSVFPMSIPVGSHPIHAVGAIRAQQIQDKSDFAVAFFGDGATSEGDLLSAMNFAGVWGTPVLFFCQNNQWAISVDRDQQTNSETISQKAEAFGYSGIQIDGNDPIATYQCVSNARKYCIKHSVPFFIEAVTYRLGDHTTSDDASRYRSEEEVKQWEQYDPLKRIRNLLEKRNQWDQERENDLKDELNEQIKTAIEEYENMDQPDPKDLFQYTFKEMPRELQKQYESFSEEWNHE